MAINQSIIKFLFSAKYLTGYTPHLVWVSRRGRTAVSGQVTYLFPNKRSTNTINNTLSLSLSLPLHLSMSISPGLPLLLGSLSLSRHHSGRHLHHRHRPLPRLRRSGSSSSSSSSLLCFLAHQDSEAKNNKSQMQRNKFLTVRRNGTSLRKECRYLSHLIRITYMERRRCRCTRDS